MCGIFAYLNYETPTSRAEILKLLITGLRRLEYRGYDSAGFCVDGDDNKPAIYKAVGNIDALEKKSHEVANKDAVLKTHIGISHTRWATHGAVCERNSHPHTSGPENEFVIVHNGIITNYDTLKQMLINKGYKFESDTDTEVVAKLLKFLWDNNKTYTFVKLVQEACRIIQGAYALIIKSTAFPGECIACKVGSPLLVGIKSKAPVRHVVDVKKFASGLSFSSENLLKQSVEYIVASDANAIVEHTKKVIFLEDRDLVHFDKFGSFECFNTTQNDDSKINKDISILETE